MLMIGVIELMCLVMLVIEIIKYIIRIY